MTSAAAEVVSSIRIDAILVTKRLRSIREEVVAELRASIEEVGLINPITICRPNGRKVPQLVSGAHRLEVARRLGWESIPCCTIAGDDADQIVLVEIDENLARGDLSAAERVEHTGKRKKIYERLHPETKHGGAPGAGRGKAHKDPNFGSFSADTAAKTGRSKSSVAQDATRAKHIPEIAKVIGTSLDQGDELDALAKLTPEQQAPIIAKAASGKKTSAKPAAKKIARAAKLEALVVRTEQASRELGSKLYTVIYADPPWKFQTYSEDGMDRAADNHYGTETTAEICEMTVPAAPDAALFIWATAPMLRDAFTVIDAWGFTYKSHYVWVKDKIGTGYWARNRHELLLIATRGNIVAPAPGEQFDSVIVHATAGHSRKPAIFREMIEQQFPKAALLEMFYRGDPVAGWDVWGNEVAA